MALLNCFYYSTINIIYYIQSDLLNMLSTIFSLNMRANIFNENFEAVNFFFKKNFDVSKIEHLIS